MNTTGARGASPSAAETGVPQPEHNRTASALDSAAGVSSSYTNQIPGREELYAATERPSGRAPSTDPGDASQGRVCPNRPRAPRFRQRLPTRRATDTSTRRTTAQPLARESPVRTMPERLIFDLRRFTDVRGPAPGRHGPTDASGEIDHPVDPPAGNPTRFPQPAGSGAVSPPSSLGSDCGGVGWPQSSRWTKLRVESDPRV